MSSQVNDILKQLMTTSNQSNLEKALLSWCSTNTEPYPGVDVKNFTTSWSDGLAFAALLHRFKPDLVDYAELTGCEVGARLERVFTAAEGGLGIERLLDVEGEFFWTIYICRFSIATIWTLSFFGRISLPNITLWVFWDIADFLDNFLMPI